MMDVCGYANYTLWNGVNSDRLANRILIIHFIGYRKDYRRNRIIMTKNSYSKNQLKGSISLFIASLIWGTAFVAQAKGADYIGGLTFSTLRSFIGAAFLVPVAIILERMSSARKRKTKNEEQRVGLLDGKQVEVVQEKDSIDIAAAEQKADAMDADTRSIRQVHMIGPVTKAELIGGIMTGTVLTAATNFQQFGIAYTSVAKAGFLTALYVIIVPLLGLFMGHKVKPYIWGCAALSLLGLYMLCLLGKSDVGFTFGDSLVLVCALLFAMQILTVDHWSPRCRGVVLSCIMFAVTGLESGVLMLIFEHPELAGVMKAMPSLLYVGILSSGVAYTLQIVGQKDLNPAVASLLMCLESVISAVSGWIILGQTMTATEMLGGGLMFLAIVLAQVIPAVKGE